MLVLFFIQETASTDLVALTAIAGAIVNPFMLVMVWLKCWVRGTSGNPGDLGEGCASGIHSRQGVLFQWG